MSKKRRAVFLDKDATVVVDKHYSADPNGIEFIHGAERALKKLSEGGFLLIMITNQSGVARGFFTEKQLAVYNSELKRRLSESGVRLDGYYYCPHFSGGTVPEYSFDCDCRKPKLKLFHLAAEELDIDIDGSYAIGDRECDLAICEDTGCIGFLVGEGEASSQKYERFFSIAEAAERILELERSQDGNYAV